MKKLILIAVLIISCSVGHGQVASVTTDKKQYAVGEIVKVTFELNGKYDSMQLPVFKDFEVMGKPSSNSSISVLNGEMIKRESRTYKLQTLKKGRFKIDSPTYYIKGKGFKGKPVKVRVVNPSSKSGKR